METCLQYDYDGQCVEYGVVPYDEFDVQSVKMSPPNEEEEDAPAFANKTLNGDNFKKYAPFIILTIVFVVFLKCWCRRNTKIVEKMKKEGGAKSGGATSGGAKLGSVKKPPKEISVTIDPDSEDNDGVPPAPSAARTLRFKEQAEKIGETFMEKVKAPFQKPMKGYQELGSESDSVAEERSEANFDVDKYGAISDRFF
ncbi:unnamed protein product [Oikopleura dioica]|uniref:Uncharacterized protein n=2 Tax=Oikopleura dioica TaxID=34765 RepID=E4YK87_OIKDI|nr:unnamed protein product [Oikopleura dioica]